ncbi:MAG: glycerate kinase, partial [Vicinamibacterales bacterium]
KISLTRWMLSRGLSIDALNAVRKHLSLIKGGQLAAAARARVETWAISDVHQPFDDDPSTIGSGPTVADPSTYAQAWDILSGLDPRWCDVHPSVATRLDAGRRGQLVETPKPGDDRLRRSMYRVIGNRHAAMAGASEAAAKAGLIAVVKKEAMRGDARTAAVRFLREAVASTDSIPGPCCFLASGETTVDVRGSGRGGRNQEFALAAGLEIATLGRSATVAAIGTDGIDGPTDAAGAVADESTASRAAHLGLDPHAALDENDSFTFFTRLGDLIVTGPTETNVGDLLIFVRG